MPALRIYSETLPYDEVTRPRTLELLRRYGLEIVLAVRPWQLIELPHVARALRDAGVSLAVWPMLADEEGRWASARNAVSFVELVHRTVDVLEEAGVPPRELLFDLEPSFNEARLLLPGGARDPRGLLGLVSGVVHRGETAGPVDAGGLAAAEIVLAGAVTDLHARGVATSSAVWPLVALDPPGERGWQSLLGTPVDALQTGRVSVMVYTSLFEGWSRGTLRRRHAVALLAAASARVVRRFGERASISLGCVGTGAFEDEPVYRGPDELAEDVALARAAGCEDITLFDLGGVLRRPPPEAWLDALAATLEARAPESRRVDAARSLARVATWALSRARRER